MKTRWLFPVLAILSLTSIFVGATYAATVSRTVSGVTDRSVYEAGNTITVSGVVNGDIVCAGQTITITATVNGDVLCAGQTVDVQGKVHGAVRLVGQTVTLGAMVTGNVSLVGQSVSVENGAALGRDLSLAAQTVAVDGSVARDITGVANDMTLNSQVGRDVTLHVTQLTLAQKADIAGSITYTSSHQLRQRTGAQLHGVLTYHETQVHHRSALGRIIWVGICWLLTLAVLSVVLVALFPRQFRRWCPAWGATFWWALLVGFIAMIVVPILAILLMLTVVGIPLGLLLFILWIAVALAAMPLAAYFAGRQLAPDLHPVLIVLIGSLVLGILGLIPFVGWIIDLVAYWVGSGALLIGLRHAYAKPDYTNSASNNA